MVFVGYQPSQRLLQWASYLPIIEPHVASLLGGIVNTDMPHIRQLGSIASLIFYNMDVSCHIDLSGMWRSACSFKTVRLGWQNVDWDVLDVC